MKEPAGAQASRTTDHQDSIVLIGNPNVGKSAVFGLLTGTYVTVSNYPGTTVELSRGTLPWAAERIPVIDTPGVNTLVPVSEDERVTRDVLLEGCHRGVLLVADSKNLYRSLLLALQLSEMEVPFLLCLNMSDEAELRGLKTDVEALSALLAVPVVSTVAVRKSGIDELLGALGSWYRSGWRILYEPRIEEAVSAILPLLPDAPLARRSLALMLLAGDPDLVEWLRIRTKEGTMEQIAAIRKDLQRECGSHLGFLINRQRLAEVDRILPKVRSREERPRRHVAERLEAWSLHPLKGIPVLAGVLYLVYLFVGVFGAGTAVDFLENALFNGYLNPLATRLVNATLPWEWSRDLLVGPYGVITMALTYAIALILPIVTTFFIAFGLLEDSGYLPRLAVLVNRFFKMMGLNGKAVLPMVLGLGCDTMATLTTRILETRKERTIVILLLALAVPCSAQLTVILAMLSSLSIWAMGIWMSIVLGVLFSIGYLSSLILPGKGSDFILEVPPLRLPKFGNILTKTLGRVEWYLKEAVPLFVVGTLILWLLDRFHQIGRLEDAVAPVLTGWLGLPKEAAPAFVLGFLRRDFGAAGLFGMASEGKMDPIQVVVSVVVITLFIPCIANFFMMVREKGWRTGLAMAAFIFPFALLVGASLNHFLRSAGIHL